MTGYGLDSRGSIPGRCKISLYSTASQPVLRPTQPPIQCLQEILPQRVNQPERETDHSPPFGEDVKNEVTPPQYRIN
jgi:hypothetical protein